MRLRVTAVLVALCTLVQTAEAQEDVAAFFKDRTVRIIVGSAAVTTSLLASWLVIGQATSPASRRSSCRTSPAQAAFL